MQYVLFDSKPQKFISYNVIFYVHNELFNKYGSLYHENVWKKKIYKNKNVKIKYLNKLIIITINFNVIANDSLDIFNLFFMIKDLESF